MTGRGDRSLKCLFPLEAFWHFIFLYFRNGKLSDLSFEFEFWFYRRTVTKRRASAPFVVCIAKFFTLRSIPTFPEDYIKVWLKDATYIKDYLFRFVKWSADFKSGASPSIVPMWIQFPNLPICFFQDYYLRSIANVVGKVLLIDLLDRKAPRLSRPSVARVCVEVDLLKKNPNRVWLGMGQYEGRWYKIVYEKDLRYCTSCSKQGHAKSNCKLRSKNSSATDAANKEKSNQQPSAPNSNACPWNH